MLELKMWLPAAFLAAYLSSGAAATSNGVRGLEGPPEGSVVCLTADQCRAKFIDMNLGGAFHVGSFPTMGCFSKNQNIFFGTGGTEEDMATTDLPGVRQRVWCAAPEPTTTRATTTATATATTTEAETTSSTTGSSSTSMAVTQGTDGTSPATTTGATGTTTTTSSTTGSSSTSTAVTQGTDGTSPATTTGATTTEDTTTEAATTEAVVDTSVTQPAFLGWDISSSPTKPVSTSPTSKPTSELSIQLIFDTETTPAEGDGEAAEESESTAIDVVSSTVPATVSSTDSSDPSEPTSETSTGPTQADIVTEESGSSSTAASVIPEYDRIKTSYIEGDLVQIQGKIFKCITPKYCNIAEWDDTLTEKVENAKALWDTAWVLVDSSSDGSGQGNPAAVSHADGDTASRDDDSLGTIGESTTTIPSDSSTAGSTVISIESLVNIASSTVSPTSKFPSGDETLSTSPEYVTESSSKPAEVDNSKEQDESKEQGDKKDDDKEEQGKDSSSKKDDDKKEGDEKKEDSKSKDDGKGKDKGKGSDKDKGKSKDSDSKKKGEIVENKLAAYDTQQEESSGKKFWVIGAVFGGFGAILLALYALKVRKRRRRDDREVIGSLPPPVSTVSIERNILDEEEEGDSGESGVMGVFNGAQSTAGESRYSSSVAQSNYGATTTASQMQSTNSTSYPSGATAMEPVCPFDAAFDSAFDCV